MNELLYFSCIAGSCKPVRLDFQNPSTRPAATLDRPGRLGARSLHSSSLSGQVRATGLCVQIARSLHSSNRFRLAKSTGLFGTLSLESLTRFGTLSLESLTPPTPFFGSLGSDIHRQCHRPTHLTDNLKETTSNFSTDELRQNLVREGTRHLEGQMARGVIKFCKLA